MWRQFDGLCSVGNGAASPPSNVQQLMPSATTPSEEADLNRCGTRNDGQTAADTMGEGEGGGKSVPLTDKLSQGWVGLEDVRLDEVLERGSLLLSRGMQVRGRRLAFRLVLPGEAGDQLRAAAVEVLSPGNADPMGFAKILEQ